jgi:predicted DNA-binding transcriptional regulator AlpA
MWIVRLLENDPGFPRPLLIRNRRYWRLSEIERWEETKRSATYAA